jgi:phospholipid/cholesterol/gamma-HCH transport system permease protein
MAVPAPTRSPRPAKTGGLRGFLAQTGELVGFAGTGLRGIPAVVRFPSEAFRQAAILIRTTSVFLIFMSLFSGFALATAGYFFLRAAGASDLLGSFTAIGAPRAVTPIIFGYVFAAKVGCGIAAEVGSMRIADEIDALESEGVDPMRYVVASRVVGAMLFIPIATGMCLLAVSFGMYMDASLVLQALPGATFLFDHWQGQSIQDQLFCLVDCSVLGMVIVLVSSFFGYRATGGPPGVGAAVARSLVLNLVLVHLIVTFFVTLFYGADPRLPFGG